MIRAQKFHKIHKKVSLAKGLATLILVTAGCYSWLSVGEVEPARSSYLYIGTVSLLLADWLFIKRIEP